MLPIGPLAIVLRHTNAERPKVLALTALSVAVILGGLALLVR